MWTMFARNAFEHERDSWQEFKLPNKFKEVPTKNYTLIRSKTVACCFLFTITDLGKMEFWKFHSFPVKCNFIYTYVLTGKYFTSLCPMCRFIFDSHLTTISNKDIIKDADEIRKPEMYLQLKIQYQRLEKVQLFYSFHYQWKIAKKFTLEKNSNTFSLIKNIFIIYSWQGCGKQL